MLYRNTTTTIPRYNLQIHHMILIVILQVHGFSCWCLLVITIGDMLHRLILKLLMIFIIHIIILDIMFKSQGLLWILWVLMLLVTYNMHIHIHTHVNAHNMWFHHKTCWWMKQLTMRIITIHPITHNSHVVHNMLIKQRFHLQIQHHIQELILTIQLHSSTTYNLSSTQFQECSDDYASFLNEPESIRWQFVNGTDDVIHAWLATLLKSWKKVKSI